MPLFDKLKGVGQAVSDKVKQTFGDPTPDDLLLRAEIEADTRSIAPPLDVPAARAVLGVGKSATVEEVRDAARVRARALHPLARRDGVGSEAARTLLGDLEALELLEEHLTPLGAAREDTGHAPPAAHRTRATPRRP